MAWIKINQPTNHFNPPPQLVLGTIELDESKICTCLAISDTVNTPGAGVEEEPVGMMGAPVPQHIMPGGRGVPIA